MYKFENELSRRNILMQCLSYSTLAGKEFLHHTFNLLSEACFVEVETKYILTGMRFLDKNNPDRPCLLPEELQ